MEVKRVETFLEREDMWRARVGIFAAMAAVWERDSRVVMRVRSSGREAWSRVVWRCMRAFWTCLEAFGGGVERVKVSASMVIWQGGGVGVEVREAMVMVLFAGEEAREKMSKYGMYILRWGVEAAAPGHLFWISVTVHCWKALYWQKATTNSNAFSSEQFN